MAAPVPPVDGMVIREDTTLAAGVHYLPNGIAIEADNVTLDGGGALLIGADRQGVGIRVNGRKDVRIRDVRLREFYHGIYAVQCEGLSISGCHITSTAEVAPNTIFLDIWLRPDQAY